MLTCNRTSLGQLKAQGGAYLADGGAIIARKAGANLVGRGGNVFEALSINLLGFGS